MDYGHAPTAAPASFPRWTAFKRALATRGALARPGSSSAGPHARSPHAPDLVLAPKSVEFQFLFFYDFHARIERPVTTEPRSADHAFFSSRPVMTSELSTFYFSDHFPDRLVRLHLHGRPDTIDVDDSIARVARWADAEKASFAVETSAALTRRFSFPKTPIGVSELVGSYSYLEVTLFCNGVLTIVLRITNAEPMSAKECVDFIAHPEFPIDAGENAPYKPGPGVVFATHVASMLEARLAAHLNTLRIEGTTVYDGVKAPILFKQREPHTRQAQLSSDRTHRVCSLEKSRPYVGTIFLTEGPESTTQAQLLAIACARATPPFLSEFADPSTYLTGEPPRRNIYFPGPSIVLIGRRGWSCGMMGSQSPLAFQMGVVETTLFAIAALNGSVRATRRYINEILAEGQKYGGRLNGELGRLDKSRRQVVFRAIRQGRLPDRADVLRRRGLTKAIYKFTAFLGRARLNSPCDDVSSLLDSYLITHTGIAAVERIKRITGHDSLITTARHTMGAYNTFLATSADYWQHVTVNLGRWQNLLALISIVAAIIGAEKLGLADWLSAAFADLETTNAPEVVPAATPNGSP